MTMVVLVQVIYTPELPPSFCIDDYSKWTFLKNIFMTETGQRRSKEMNLPPTTNVDGGSLATTSSSVRDTSTPTIGICFSITF